MNTELIHRLEARLDDQTDALQSISATLIRQEAILAEHIRRTALLESEITPIKAHVLQVNGALKLIGIVGLLISVVSGILALWSHV